MTTQPAAPDVAQDPMHKVEGVASFLESAFRTNSRDIEDWREDVHTAAKVLRSALEAARAPAVRPEPENWNIIFAVCRMALHAPTEALIHQIDRLAAAVGGKAQQSLLALLHRAKNPTPQRSVTPLVPSSEEPAVRPEPANWRDHVEQRIRTWRQRTMNRSGDMLAIDDFMGADSIDDLVDFVCDEWAAPQPAPAVRQPVAWQPIETAPKDGTTILLAAPGRVTAGEWHPEQWPTASEYHGTTGEYLGQYETGECTPAAWYSWDGGFTDEDPPTHWMPLPTQPKPAQSEEVARNV